MDESRGSSRRQTGEGQMLGRQSRASRDLAATSEDIRPTGLSDDLWQRFLQVGVTLAPFGYAVES